MQHIRTLETIFGEVACLEDKMALSTWHRVAIKESTPLTEASSAEPGKEINRLLGLESTRKAMEICLERLGSLEPDRIRDVISWHSRWWRAACLPGKLVAELSKQCDRCKAMWERSDVHGNSRDLRQTFSHIVSLTREKADIWRGTGTRYDALLDVYDPGQTATSLTEQYGWLDTFGGAASVPSSDLQARATPAEALSVAQEVAELCGFDHERGRIVHGRHPMTLTTGSNDVRILIGQGTNQAFLRQVLHEVGHAVLEQDLKMSVRWSWRAQTPSQAFHETIAKFFELSGPVLLRQYGSETLDASIGILYHRALDCPPRGSESGRKSTVRLESTGLWYSWHIWLRFKLERMLIDGALEPSDTPDAWDQEVRRKFENSKAESRTSWFQDIHWFMGLFGYFPVYWNAIARGSILREHFERKLGRCDSRSSLLSILHRELRRSFMSEWDRVEKTQLRRLKNWDGVRDGMSKSDPANVSPSLL
jgi:carboxypeptidase Taq